LGTVKNNKNNKNNEKSKAFAGCQLARPAVYQAEKRLPIEAITPVRT
jgi:hypothetical protein